MGLPNPTARYSTVERGEAACSHGYGSGQPSHVMTDSIDGNRIPANASLITWESRAGPADNVSTRGKRVRRARCPGTSPEVVPILQSGTAVKL